MTFKRQLFISRHLRLLRVGRRQGPLAGGDVAQVISKKIKPYKPYFTPFPDIGDKLSRILFEKFISQFRARPPARGGLDQDQGRLCHTGLWNKKAKKTTHATLSHRNGNGTHLGPFFFPQTSATHAKKKGGNRRTEIFLLFATSFSPSSSSLHSLPPPLLKAPANAGNLFWPPTFFCPHQTEENTAFPNIKYLGLSCRH